MSVADIHRALGRAGRDALYLTLALVSSVVAFAVWVTGVSVTLSLAVFIVGLPVFLLLAGAFRWTVELDRRNAALVLGRPLRGRYRSRDAAGFVGRLKATAQDPQTWRDLLWLVLHSVLGFAFGTAALVLAGTVIGVATHPLWYWALPEGTDWGIWRIDTLGEALASVPLAIPLAALTVLLLRGMALGHARLAAALIGSPGGDAQGTAAPAEKPRRERPWVAIHLAAALLVGVTATVVWWLTGGYFWPGWVWFGALLPWLVHAAVRLVLGRTAPGPRRVLALHAVGTAGVAVAVVAVWALAGGGYFWPAWPLLGVAMLLTAHAAWVRLMPAERERELEERVDVLTRTRRGALDVQAAELRRIERDLHDGAQARLVALSMELGRAEARLAGQPELAALVRRARGQAAEAIAELRDLARGIAPPVLADRGLVAAVEALGRRVTMPVEVEARIDRRPPPVLETAAYFVVSEALANVAKHAPAASVRVSLSLDERRLAVEVADDGPGGADPAGGGLTGLRHRVEALDGTLTVTSPPGRGTIIRAELPCES